MFLFFCKNMKLYFEDIIEGNHLTEVFIYDWKVGKCFLLF